MTNESKLKSKSKSKVKRKLKPKPKPKPKLERGRKMLLFRRFRHLANAEFIHLVF